MSCHAGNKSVFCFLLWFLCFHGTFPYIPSVGTSTSHLPQVNLFLLLLHITDCYQHFLQPHVWHCFATHIHAGEISDVIDSTKNLLRSFLPSCGNGWALCAHFILFKTIFFGGARHKHTRIYDGRDIFT